MLCCEGLLNSLNKTNESLKFSSNENEPSFEEIMKFFPDKKTEEHLIRCSDGEMGNLSL